jgi:predicted alpha/beta hydrolase family esterase
VRISPASWSVPDLDDWVGAVATAFAVAGDGPDRPATATFGDIVHATHIAVLVPGMGASLDGAALLDRARHLYDAARVLVPDVAVVGWVGYSPPGAIDVLIDDDAVAGGDALTDYVASLPSAARVTVVAHSYGSVVAGEALRDGMHADAVVLVGSPGVGAATAASATAAVGDAMPIIYAERAPFDGVGLSEAYGRDPADPRFGAVRLATGPEVRGHSAYFDEGTLALENMAAVVAGRDDLVVTITPSELEVVAGRVDDAWAAVVEAPVDGAQDALASLNDGIDIIESAASPDGGPLAAVAGADEAVRGAALEEARRVVDVVQRVTSPDAVADVAGDVWSVVWGE